MKRTHFILWCLVCAAALAWVFQQTQAGETLDGPPRMEIRCGDQTETSGIWYAGWDSPIAKFNADGDPPYSPYGRDNFPLLQAAPGDTVYLSFAVPPREVGVSMDYDVPVEEWGMDLFEGTGDPVAVTLPENCGGAYTVWAKWAYGSAAYGFIIEDTVTEHPEVVEEVPALTLSRNGEQIPAWQGSWEWRVPDGPGSFTETPAAGHGTLQAKDDLPVIPAKPGEEIVLEFDSQPHEIVVWAIPGKYAADPQNAKSAQVFLGAGNVLTVPADGTDVVYEVFARWDYTRLNGGRCFYGFYVP